VLKGCGVRATPVRDDAVVAKIAKRPLPPVKGGLGAIARL